MERWLEALVAFDEVITREALVSGKARRWVAYSRTGRGDALRGLGDHAGAVDAYSEGITALAEEEEPAIRKEVWDMMIRKGQALSHLERWNEASAIFDGVIAVTDPLAASSVATAYLGKVGCQVARRDTEAAIATTDAAVGRFGSSDDPIVRLAVAACLDVKVDVLREMGRDDAAMLTAEQLVNRFGADLDKNIERIVSPHAHRLGRSRSRLRFLGLG